jgi:hypothetical protein
MTTTKPTPKPVDVYLGPRCPVCGTPWAAHPNHDENGDPVACAIHRPASAPFDSAAFSADLAARRAARKN